MFAWKGLPCIQYSFSFITLLAVTVNNVDAFE